MLTPEHSRQMEEHDGPLPADGQRIRCRLRDGDIITGTVTLVWLAMDTTCINVSYHGATVHVYPSLGDTWEAA